MGQAGSSRPEATNVAVHISLQQQSYELGKSIDVRVQLTNNAENPLILPNIITLADIYTDTSNGHIEFTLTDLHGEKSPETRMIADTFGRFPTQPEPELLLGRWFVLYPHESFTTVLKLDETILSFLARPGKYKLSATYSTAGLGYPMSYKSLGWTEQQVASLPFAPWGGKINSNSVWIYVSAESNPRHGQK
jgi:hypothetical protein